MFPLDAAHIFSPRSTLTRKTTSKFTSVVDVTLPSASDVGVYIDDEAHQFITHDQRLARSHFRSA